MQENDQAKKVKRKINKLKFAFKIGVFLVGSTIVATGVSTAIIASEIKKSSRAPLVGWLLQPYDYKTSDDTTTKHSKIFITIPEMMTQKSVTDSKGVALPGLSFTLGDIFAGKEFTYQETVQGATTTSIKHIVTFGIQEVR